MKQKRWISFLLSMILLATAAIPAKAASVQNGDTTAPEAANGEQTQPENESGKSDDATGNPDDSAKDDSDSTSKDPADSTGNPDSTSGDSADPTEDNPDSTTGDPADPTAKPGDSTENPGDSTEDPGQTTPSSDVTPSGPQEGETVSRVPLQSTGGHTAYAYGSTGEFPSFNPKRHITRAEAAQLLYRLLSEKVTPETSYSDVPEDAWYAEAVRTMGTLGVLEPDVDNKINPGEEISRGEFVRYVASFFPLRTDADAFQDVLETDENEPYIRSARAYGWAQGGADGMFVPDRTVTRAEAVVILNRALNRVPDKNYIDEKHPAFYLDITRNDWYYYDIMEASVGHEQTKADETSAETWSSHTARTNTPSDGLHLVDGWLYYYDSAAGDIVRDAEKGTFSFNTSGHYTSGSDELDWKLRGIVMAKTNDSMSQTEKLRALYLYTRDSFTYLRRAAYEFGATGFMQKDALDMLNNGYGNCYSYASVFWYLSRWIGYDSSIYSGTVGQNRAPHSWVEITLDGKRYIFDTELEMAYRRKGRYDINLYKLPAYSNSWNYRRP